MSRHARRGGHVIAAVAGITSILALVAAYALWSIDKHAAGTAAAIALPAAAVFAVVLAWLFSRDRDGGTS